MAVVRTFMSRPLRVLVVDDNQDAADSAALLLELRGHEARVAHTGAEAVADSAAFPPDVVLLDLSLPDADGVRVAERLCRTLAHRPLLVAVTGRQHQEDRVRQAGFDHCLLKPYNPRILCELLERHAGRLAAA